MFRPLKILLIAVVAVAIAGSTYAYAAAVNFSPTNAGYGTEAITDYTVTHVDYVVNALDGSKFDQINITLGSAATRVLLSYNLATGVAPTSADFVTCALNGGVWECPNMVGAAGDDFTNILDLKVVALQEY